ncbi:IS66 family transposase [Bacteroides fragilis]|uniref:IS66 family transposase n=1 Tax=Bacteroides fragilis TaxID=817 RepID=A0A396BXU7_BACFG|nr:IS66 family transposase [Bacteroides fragilis]
MFESSLSEQLQEIEAAKEAAEKEIKESTVERKKERQTCKMLEGLPVVEVVIEPEGVDLTLYKRIGEERTRTLEFEPGKLYVKEIVRPKYGLKANTTLPEAGKSGVMIAPLPLLPIYKGLPGASLLAEMLLQKYEYHAPFYRQIQSFRHLGVRLSESSLNGWFKPACELLAPLYEVLKEETLKADYIQVDETTLPVIDNQAHRAKKEYLWVVRSVIDGVTFFHYQDGSRSTQVVEKLLTTFQGYLQSDRYQVYNVFSDKEGVCLAGCMAHIGRHFEQALDEHKSLAEYALAQIQSLYNIERMADNDEFAPEQRAELRQRLATPIMDALERWMEATYPKVLPKSRMGQAIDRLCVSIMVKNEELSARW